MRTERWVLDITHWSVVEESGLYAFVPYDPETGEVLIGMVYLGSECPGELVGVWHSDGQDAVRAWVDAHRTVLAGLMANTEG